MVKRIKYEAGDINNLLQRIQNAWGSGQKQDFEIHVDGMKVIPRTADPQQFESHSDFINENSKTMTVLLFKGASNMNEKIIFQFQDALTKEPGLSGIPENMTLSEYNEKQKADFLKELRLEQLEKENGELKTQVGEKQLTIDQLSTRLQELHEGKLIGIGEMGSEVLKTLFKKSKLKETFPVLEGLFGPDEANNISPEQEATFSRKGEKDEANSYQIELTEEQERHLILIHDLQARLNTFQLASVMHILDIITKCPEIIGPTLKHVSNWIETHKPQKEDEKV